MIDQEETERLMNEISAMSRKIAELEQSNAELKLRVNEPTERGERFRLLMENSGDPMLLLDKSTKCVECNEAAVRILGVPSKEGVVGLSPLDFSSPYQPDGFPTAMKAKQVVRETMERGNHRFEWSHRRPDRSDFVVEVSLTVLPMEQRMFFVHWHDISERILAEKKLRESEQRFAAAFMKSGVPGAITTIREGRFVDLNEAFSRIVGVRREDVIGATSIDLGFFTPEQRSVYVERFREKGEVENLEVELKSRDGETKYGLFNAKKITIADEDFLLSTITDITERILSEKALKESEERFRRLHEASFGGICIHDEGIVLEANQGLAMITGHEFDDLIGMDGKRLIAPEFRDIVEKNIQSGYERPYEVMGLRKGGSTYPLELQGKVIPYGGKEVRIAEFRDITERRKAGAMLKESEERYRNIFDNASEGIYQSTPEGRFVYVNPALARILGYDSPEECIASVTDMSRQVYADSGMREEYRLILEREGFRAFELEVKTKDGSLRWMLNNMKAVRNENNEVIFYEGFVQDVTRRKQAEEAFYKSFSSNPCMMSISTLAGTLTDINESFTRSTGFQRDEVIGRSFVDLGIMSPDIFERIGKQLAEQGHVYAMEIRHPKKTGEFCIQLFSAEMMEIGDARYILAAAQDITSHKQMEAELTKTRNLESIGTLAGGIAHDFNNLLMAVTGYISLAKILLPSDSQGFSFLADAERISLAGKELTQKLITFSKGGTSVRNVVDLAPVIAHASRMAFAGSNIQSDHSIEESLFPVYADPTQILQVIQSVLINAKEAMPQGGTVRVTAGNCTPLKGKNVDLPDGDYVRISIEDCGKGIREEDLPRIFDPYFTTKDMGPERGMGMGLAVVYSIVKRHNGHVSVESKPVGGTTVHIYLPAYTGDMGSPQNRKDVPREKAAKVLYMDDDENVRNVGRVFIAGLGYRVVTAANGGEAVKLYAEALDKGKGFDAVILDLTVRGGMGGKEAFDAIRAVDTKVKAIISSGYTDDPVLSGYAGHGFKAAIVKPYKVEELKETLERVIGDGPGRTG